jgi:hypothetical protein
MYAVCLGYDETVENIMRYCHVSGVGVTNNNGFFFGTSLQLQLIVTAHTLTPEQRLSDKSL